MEKKRTVYYVVDKKAIEVTYNIPNIGSRAAVVHSLIASYHLFPRCKLCVGRQATDEELQSFHTSTYIDCLKKAEMSSDLEKISDSEEAIDFNLGYDCPLFPKIYEFVKVIAGATLAAAEKLISKDQLYKIENQTPVMAVKNSVLKPKSYLKIKGKPFVETVKKDDVFDLSKNFTSDENLSLYNLPLESDLKMDLESNLSDTTERCVEKVNYKVIKSDFEVDDSEQKEHSVAINWLGGWHHAQRDQAEGFCYVNDIVIAIQYLLKSFKRILYVDLDVHHGNGVENAFSFSPRVFTFSIHKYETGFYPASGSLNDIGQGNGKYYTANVPLKSGITGDKYVELFKKLFSAINQRYKPQCLVIQCGADCIAGDPLGGLNLTPEALGKCLKVMLHEELPTLILGGGGYNVPNTARCWAYLTSVALDCEISELIPENLLFGPDFDLSIVPSLMRDENTESYLREIEETILNNLKNLPDLEN